VSDSEVLVIFVTPDGEGTARNISEWRKIMYRRRYGKESKGNRKYSISIYLRELFTPKYKLNVLNSEQNISEGLQATIVIKVYEIQNLIQFLCRMLHETKSYSTVPCKSHI